MPTRTPDKWHVGKEIPLVVLLMLVIQTGGGIWWLAQVSSKIDYAVAQLQQFQLERYTREDARHDRELLISMVDALKQRDADHDRRLGILEDRNNNFRLRSQP